MNSQSPLDHTVSEENCPGQRHNRVGLRPGKGNAKAVIGVGGLAAVAFLLGSLFNGFGTGPGSGDGEGDADNTNVQANIDANVQPRSLDDINTGNVVNVLVDGNQYFVLKSPEADVYDVSNYQAADRKQIVEKAISAPGDSGVKIRIRMRSNATALAENELNDALLNAGLAPTQIAEDETTVP